MTGAVEPIPGVPGLTGLQVLARGGYSTVYRAVQESVGREVAVKVERLPLEGEREQRRFLREARAAGRMSSHPHVVDLFDAGVTEAGYPYLVMELCDGSYADRLVAGPVTVAEVRDVGVKIADALADAHALGVLHRDVKPSNILLTRFGEPALTDFGLATLAESRDSDSSVLLEVLTPAYAPPEVFRHGAPSPAVDVYALSATLYALVSGRPPRWPGDRVPALVALMELFAEPIPSLPGVPEDLTRVLRRGMSNDPVDRPTAGELRDALAGISLGRESPPLATRSVTVPVPATVGAGTGQLPWEETIPLSRLVIGSDQPPAGADELPIHSYFPGRSSATLDYDVIGTFRRRSQDRRPDQGSSPGAPPFGEEAGLTDVRFLARSPTATVYVATQRSVGREVVVKVEDQRRGAGEHERALRAAARMSDHPNVVDVYDAGVTRDGRRYTVMQLCAVSYADRLSGSPMPPPEVRTVGAKIADALAAAHDLGMVHGAVKPTNILVTRFGEPALSDFGARYVADPLSAGFRAPEGGSSRAADVYGLCATLIALSSGAHPDRATAAEGDPAMADLLRAGLSADPAKRPTAAVLRDRLSTPATSQAPVETPRRRRPGSPWAALRDGLDLAKPRRDRSEARATAGLTASMLDLEQELDRLTRQLGPPPDRHEERP